jgi:site-specific DNA recombinase
MFKLFKQFVTEKNIPECKKFIANYVDRVVVFQDRLEVTFKVAFSFEQKNNIYSFKTFVKLANLFKTYGTVAGM